MKSITIRKNREEHDPPRFTGVGVVAGRFGESAEGPLSTRSLSFVVAIVAPAAVGAVMGVDEQR